MCALFSHPVTAMCKWFNHSNSFQDAVLLTPFLLWENQSDCYTTSFSIWNLLHFICLCSDRRPGEDSDAESSRETSSAGSSDCEAERRVKGVDGVRVQHNVMNLNSQRLSRITLRDKHPMSSSSDETEVYNSNGLLVFEYFEQEQPHHRQPLYDKARQCSSYLRYGVFSTFFFSPDLYVCGFVVCPHHQPLRFQILHLNFQNSVCTEAVTYCLVAGSLWLGKNILFIYCTDIVTL